MRYSRGKCTIESWGKTTPTLLTRYKFVLLLKTVPEQLAGSSCVNEYLIEYFREAQMPNATDSAKTILARFLHWLCPKRFSTRQELAEYVRLMLTYRKKSQEERRWRQRLSRSLQTSQKLYWGCHKNYDELLKKAVGYEKSIISQAATIARREENIVALAKTIVSQKKIMDGYGREIETLGKSLTKVHQNEQEALKKIASQEKMIADQEAIIADKDKFIKYLWTRIPFP